MRKKIIVAVDQSIYSKHAMNYAIQISKKIGNIDFILINIQPIISQYLVEEAMKRPKAQKELNDVYQFNRQASYQLLEEVKATMVDKGVDIHTIEIRSQIRNSGIAEDILSIAESGSYDGILIGRRGIGALQELFMGSVTSNLLSTSQVIPIWVVDGQVASDAVMVAVDGSPASLRAVDHLAYIFSENASVKLSFLNIEPRIGDMCEIDTENLEIAELENVILNSNQKCISNFTAQALGILQKAGIQEQQISFITAQKSFSPGKSILNSMRSGRYGTVVIGKSGIGNSPSVGKVARHILQKITDGTVWVVP